MNILGGYFEKRRRSGRHFSFSLLFTVFFMVMSLFPFYAHAIDVEVDKVKSIETVENISLVQGQSVVLKAYFQMYSGKKVQAKDIEWSLVNANEDRAYITIDKNSGKIAALLETKDPVPADGKEVLVKVRYLKQTDLEETVTVTLLPRKVTGISVSPTFFSLQVGESKPFAVTATYNDRKTSRLTPQELANPELWSVEVDPLNGSQPEPVPGVKIENGKITGVEAYTEPYKVTITSKVDPDVKTTVFVEVYKVDKIEITPSATNLIAGQTGSYKATFIYTNGKKAPANNVVWSSQNVKEDGSIDENDDEKVIEINEKTGKFTAVIAGTAKIKATYTFKNGANTEEVTSTLGESAITVSERNITELIASPATLSLLKGESKPIKFTMVENDGTKKPVTSGISWTVEEEDKAFVKVVNGVVTATDIKREKGVPVETKVTIVAEFEYKQGLTKTVKIPVRINSVQAVEVIPQDFTMVEGQTRALSARLVYTDGTRAQAGRNVLWKYKGDESGSEFFTIDPNGKVTARYETDDNGKEIQATYVGDETISGTATIKIVPNEVDTLSITPSSLTLKAGESKSLRMNVRYKDGKIVTMSPTRWEIREGNSDQSNDKLPIEERIAFIDSMGKITGLKSGEVKAVAIYQIDKKTYEASIPVAVYGVTKIELRPAGMSLVQGQSATMKAELIYSDGKRVPLPKGAKWASSNSSVASVDDTGKVNGVAGGTATVSVSYMGTSSNEVDVAVTENQIVGLTIAPNSLQLMPGDNKPITVTALYHNGVKETIPPANWKSVTSTDPTVATIVNGKVVALKEGATELSLRYNGMTASVFAQVGRASVVSRIEVVAPSVTLFQGQSTKIRTYLIYSDGKKKEAPLGSLDYIPENESMVSIAPNGTIVGVAGGNTQIHVVYKGSPRRESSVNVTVIEKKVTSLTVSPGSLSMSVGDTKKLKATVTTNDGKSGAASDVRWEAQDGSIIEVNGVTGDVKALQPGSTFITASVPGSSNTVTVPVKVEGIVALELSPGELMLTEGQSGKFKASLVYSNGRKVSLSQGLIWGSDSEKLKVDTLTGTITAASIDGEETMAQVKVRMTEELARKYQMDAKDPVINVTADVRILAKKVMSLTVVPQKLSLRVGEERSLRVMATFSDRSKADVTKDVDYSVYADPLDSGQEVIRVVNEGDALKVSAESPGRAEISIRYKDKSIESAVTIRK